MAIPYKRILLKLSGEALAGEKGFGLDPEILHSMAKQIQQVYQEGHQIGVVIGGGNFMRGGQQKGIDRVAADHMGMLATVMNCIAMQDALEKLGMPTRLMSGIQVSSVAEPFVRRRAVALLEKSRLVLFAAGTGNPFFTTDSAASLRAIEIDADILMKATNVDGVYDSDPKKNPAATKYEHLTFTEAINKQLKVMDTAAMALCRENDKPILVFNMNVPGNLIKAARGEKIGTLVTNGN